MGLWGGASLGLVFGGKGGVSGCSEESDREGNGMGQGLWSPFGYETWLYLGGIVGYGDVIGPYVTAGPLIGKNWHFGVGGGVAIGKTFGFGVIVPVDMMLGDDNPQTRAYFIGAAAEKTTEYVSRSLDYLYQHAPRGVEYLRENASEIAAITAGTIAAAYLLRKHGRRIRDTKIFKSIKEKYSSKLDRIYEGLKK